MSYKDTEPTRIFVEDVTHVLLADGTDEYYAIEDGSFVIGSHQFWEDWGDIDIEPSADPFVGFSFVHAGRNIAGSVSSVIALKYHTNTERVKRLKSATAPAAIQ